MVFLSFKRTFTCPKHRSDCKPGGRYAGRPNILHLNKAHTLHQLDKIPNRDRSSNSVRPSLKTVNHPGREIQLQDDICKLKTTVGLKDAVYLLKTPLLQR